MIEITKMKTQENLDYQCTFCGTEWRTNQYLTYRGGHGAVCPECLRLVMHTKAEMDFYKSKHPDKFAFPPKNPV